ncbi:MAG: pyridoxine 5'-phosphate synthase [Flavobacteriales bacterium]|nr:pyridoxine 5'-phosphate synthase [Flavobacteriales bacterium]
MTSLSVNINKIATIRNARGGNIPDVVKAAIDLENFGAEGITVHPRPDERHITRRDVYELAKVVKTEFNIEGYPDERYMAMVLDVKPAQATLVPDPPGVLTSNAGWDVRQHRKMLEEIIVTLKKAGIRTSIFLEADSELVKAAADTGTDRIELYTESYASGYVANREAAIRPFVEAARTAVAVGLGLNAGHDLSLQNLRYFAQHVDQLLEVSIGHALISDALYFGLENTVNMYKHQLR